jgi:alpha-L-fucosidase
MGKKCFFEPWIPPKYKQGIKGKKILVLGASYYCRNTGCSYYDDCTNTEEKDSSCYDKTCPAISAENNRCLHDEPKYTTGETQAYTNFAHLFDPYTKEGENVWNEYLAFTNYVQFFLPCSKDDKGRIYPATTRPKFLSNRDFEAFVEVVQELQPDIVIFWGMAIEKAVRLNNKYIYDLNDCFNKTEGYICHMHIPNIDHSIALLNCYHPSSRYWNSSLENATKYLRKLLDI